MTTDRDSHSADFSLGWGIVGPGEIAGVFAAALGRGGVGRVVRVCGRSVERSKAFADRHGGRAAAALEELLEDDEVEAVYVATPHPMHAAPAEAAMRAGRAVLCEKPMTTSPHDTRRLIELSRSLSTPLVEAWMYRTHPQIARLVELVRDGAVGRVHSIETAFGFDGGPDLSERLASPELGGGAILDVGGYPLSMALLIAGALMGPSSRSPRFVDASGTRSDRGVDLSADATLDFGDGLTGRLRTSVQENLGISATIYGDAGSLHLPCAFVPENRREGTRGVIEIRTAAGTREESLDASLDCFAAEAAEMGRLVRAGRIEAQPPMVNHEDSIAIATLLDEWRERVADAAPR